MPSKPGPPRSATVRVVLNTDKGRVTYELTRAQVRALATVSASGRVSDATPFATARSLTHRGLLQQRGPEWYVTQLGKSVCQRAVNKRAERR